MFGVVLLFENGHFGGFLSHLVSITSIKKKVEENKVKKQQVEVANLAFIQTPRET